MKEAKRQLADKIIAHIEGDTTIPYEMVLLQLLLSMSELVLNHLDGRISEAYNEVLRKEGYEDYKHGSFAETEICVKAGDRTRIRFEKTGSYEDSIERLTVKLVSKKKGAFWVTVDGEQIPRYLVRDAWEESESGWYYELSDRSILVKCPKPKKDSFEIVVSTEKLDLIGMADE